MRGVPKILILCKRCTEHPAAPKNGVRCNVKRRRSKTTCVLQNENYIAAVLKLGISL